MFKNVIRIIRNNFWRRQFITSKYCCSYDSSRFHGKMIGLDDLFQVWAKGCGFGRAISGLVQILWGLDEEFGFGQMTSWAHFHVVIVQVWPRNKMSCQLALMRCQVLNYFWMKENVVNVKIIFWIEWYGSN